MEPTKELLTIKKSFLKSNNITSLLEKKKKDFIPYVFPVAWIHTNQFTNISEKNRYQKITDLFLKLRVYLNENPQNELIIAKEFFNKHGIYEREFFDIETLSNFILFINSDECLKIDPSKSLKEIIIEACFGNVYECEDLIKSNSEENNNAYLKTKQDTHLISNNYTNDNTHNETNVHSENNNVNFMNSTNGFNNTNSQFNSTNIMLKSSKNFSTNPNRNINISNNSPNSTKNINLSQSINNNFQKTAPITKTYKELMKSQMNSKLLNNLNYYLNPATSNSIKMPGNFENNNDNNYNNFIHHYNEKNQITIPEALNSPFKEERNNADQHPILNEKIYKIEYSNPKAVIENLEPEISKIKRLSINKHFYPQLEKKSYEKEINNMKKSKKKLHEQVRISGQLPLKDLEELKKNNKLLEYIVLQRSKNRLKLENDKKVFELEFNKINNVNYDINRRSNKESSNNFNNEFKNIRKNELGKTKNNFFPNIEQNFNRGVN